MDAAVLKNIKVFAGLDDDYLHELAAHARETTVPEGATLMKEGDYAYDLMAIVEGEASVQRDGAEVATLAAGDSFGEIGVVEHKQRTATVTATSPMRLVCFSSWDVKRLGQDVLLVIKDQIQSRQAEQVH